MLRRRGSSSGTGSSRSSAASFKRGSLWGLETKQKKPTTLELQEGSDEEVCLGSPVNPDDIRKELPGLSIALRRHDYTPLRTVLKVGSRQGPTERPPADRKDGAPADRDLRTETGRSGAPADQETHTSLVFAPNHPTTSSAEITRLLPPCPPHLAHHGPAAHRAEEVAELGGEASEVKLAIRCSFRPRTWRLWQRESQRCNRVVKKLFLNSLENLTIPDSVTHIGVCAFAECSSLVSLTIPNSVTHLGDGAFQDCSSLVNLTIPNSVTRIGRGAFMDCSDLASLTIPDTVTRIENLAFRGCCCDDITSILELCELSPARPSRSRLGPDELSSDCWPGALGPSLQALRDATSRLATGLSEEELGLPEAVDVAAAEQRLCEMQSALLRQEALQHLRATLAGRQGAARHMVGYKMRLDWQGVLPNAVFDTLLDGEAPTSGLRVQDFAAAAQEVAQQADSNELEERCARLATALAEAREEQLEQTRRRLHESLEMLRQASYSRAVKDFRQGFRLKEVALERKRQHALEVSQAYVEEKALEARQRYTEQREDRLEEKLSRPRAGETGRTELRQELSLAVATLNSDDAQDTQSRLHSIHSPLSTLQAARAETTTQVKHVLSAKLLAAEETPSEEALKALREVAEAEGDSGFAAKLLSTVHRRRS
eukprot:g22194.t1